MVGRIFERLRMFFREVAASKEISEEVIKKSFLVTGQSKNSRPSDIACLKEGRECHSILPKVEEMWDQPLENLKKVENPCEIDESESDKNEMVIFDE